MILQETNGQLKRVSRKDFATEKELQSLVENNLLEVFGCRLVATEFSTGKNHSGRIDSLALSEDGNPVIIEYKKVENPGLVTQALFYLDWLKDHKGDFQVAVQGALGKVEIDWSYIRVLCIAPSFDRYSLHAVKHMGANLELWQYHRYANGVLQLEEIFKSAESSSGHVVKASEKELAQAEEAKVEVTFESHSAKAKGEVANVLATVRELILGLGDEVVEVPVGLYVAYKVGRNFVCIEVQQKKLRIWLPLKYDSSMPDFARDVSNIGHWGTGDLEIQIDKESQIDPAFDLIRQAFLQAGA